MIIAKTGHLAATADTLFSQLNAVHQLIQIGTHFSARHDRTMYQIFPTNAQHQTAALSFPDAEIHRRRLPARTQQAPISQLLHSKTSPNRYISLTL